MLLAAEPETSAPLIGPLRDHGFEIAVPGGHADVVIAGAEAEVERLSAEAPVILLGGADDAPVDRVLAFRRGCDDYSRRPSTTRSSSSASGPCYAAAAPSRGCSTPASCGSTR